MAEIRAQRRSVRPMDIEPVIAICQALASLCEALQELTPGMPRAQATAFEARLLEVRRSRSALQLWVEENR